MPPRAEEVMLKLNYFIVSVLPVWLWVVEGVLANDWCPIQGGGVVMRVQSIVIAAPYYRNQTSVPALSSHLAH